MADDRAVSSTEDLPILIPSDDESDSDDVVLIKEEIDVDDDDVIFLSETKPDTIDNKRSCGPNHLLVPHDVSASQNTTGANGYHRSYSLSTLTTDLNLNDTNTVNDPLDLSSKVLDTANLATQVNSLTSVSSLLSQTRSNDADAQNSFLPPTMFFQSLANEQQIGSTNGDLADLQSSTVDSVTLGSKQSAQQQNVGNVMSLSSDLLPGVPLAQSRLPGASIVCTSICHGADSIDLHPSHLSPHRCSSPTAVPGPSHSLQGLSQFTACSSQSVLGSNQSGTGSNNSGPGLCQSGPGSSQSNSQTVVQDKQHNLTPVCQSPLSSDNVFCSLVRIAPVSENSDAIISSSGQCPSTPVSTGFPGFTYKPTPLMFDLSPPPNFSMAPSATMIAPPILTSSSPMKTVNTYSGSFGTSRLSATDTSLMTTTTPSSVLITSVGAGNPIASIDAQSNSTVVNQSVPVKSNPDSSNDYFVNAQMLISSLDPMWPTDTQTGGQTTSISSDISNQSVTSSANICNQSSSADAQSVSSTTAVSQSTSNYSIHRLLGGSQQNLNPQSSIILCVNSNTCNTMNSSLDIYVSGANDTQSVTGNGQTNKQTIMQNTTSAFTSVCSSANQTIPSNTITSNINPLKRSLSFDQPMYNPLTLPKFMHPLQQKQLASHPASSIHTASNDAYTNPQNQRLQRSLSIPNTNDTGPSATTIGSNLSKASSATTEASQSRGLHQLPPKKQKRCFSVDSCARCIRLLAGEKFSRCPVGHGACSTCLEDRVKLVLTGKAKGSVKCLNSQCDSFYPISELKLSLPSMVVEILEDKLDLDYIDFVSDMMIKNATGDDGAGPGGSGPGVEYMDLGGATSSGKQKDPELPEHWEPMADTKEPYILVSLEPDSDEYGEVVMRFFQSMTDAKFEVQNVYRLQNSIQWKYYCVKKMEMLQDNEGFGGVEERRLFHGTAASVVDAICKKGFDWRLCGKHGTIYGQGSYFAVNASYSHQYTDAKRPQSMSAAMSLPNTPAFMFNPLTVNYSQPSQISPIGVVRQTQTALNLSATSSPNKNMLLSAMLNYPHIQSGANCQPQPQRYKVTPRQLAVGNLFTSSADSTTENERHTAKLFLASVLVGKYVGGNSKLRKPPPLDPKADPFGKCYDSCVDNIHFPKIFVIFESAQAYPEYLIEYSYE